MGIGEVGEWDSAKIGEVGFGEVGIEVGIGEVGEVGIVGSEVGFDEVGFGEVGTKWDSAKNSVNGRTPEYLFRDLFITNDDRWSYY